MNRYNFILNDAGLSAVFYILQRLEVISGETQVYILSIDWDEYAERIYLRKLRE